MYDCLDDYCRKWAGDCTPTPDDNDMDSNSSDDDGQDTYDGVEETEEDWQLTVVQMFRVTEPDEDLFIAGSAAEDR